MATTKRRRAPAERPAQILDAAARVVLRDGLNATVDDIAAEAGVGKGTVYEYFGSKGQIFTAMRGRWTDQTLAAGDAAVPAAVTLPAIERLRLFLSGMFAYSVAHAELMSLLFHEAGIEETDEFGPVAARLEAMVRAGVAAGELSVDEPGFTVEFMLHGLHGVMESAIARHEPAEVVLARVDPVLEALLKPC